MQQYILFLVILIAIWLTARGCRHPVVKRSRVQGYGVFARRHYQPGTRIEACAALKMPEGDLGPNILRDYAFQHPLQSDQLLIAHGNCGLYNHSEHPNATYITRDKSVTIYAVRHIYPGDEIFVSYGPGYWQSREKRPR